MSLARKPTIWILLVWAAALSAAYPSAGFGFQPLITDDTGTQGAGGNQVELAVNRQEFESAGVTTTTRSFPFVFTRGLTEALDVYAGIAHNRISSSDPGAKANGQGNPTLGLKWRFFENEQRKLSIGLKPEIAFGTSSEDEARGLAFGRNSYSCTGIVTQETGFGAVHVNYAFARVDYALESNRSAHRRTLHRLSVAPVIEVSSGWRLAVDAGLTTNPHRVERARMGYAELGAIWSPSKDLDLALGAIAFLGDGEPRSSILTAGVTWRFR